jgi:hypothetical protein
MKTCLAYNTKNLVRRLDCSKYFHEIKENKNELCVIRRYNNIKRKPFVLKLPKQIKITPEAVGLIIGEGYFESFFVFANSNKKAIREILKFLSQFRLNIINYLELSVKNMPQNFIQRSKQFWKKELDFPIQRIRLRKEFNNLTENGTLHLAIYNILFGGLIKKLINEARKKMEKNKKLAVGYLKGILAAEGNINVKKKTSCVYMIRISASKQEERDHYKKCLERAGIKIFCKDMPTVSKKEAIERGWKTTKGRAGAVIISKWDNFIKILELDLLGLSEDKKQKFMKYMLYNKFTKQFLDFGCFLGKEFTAKEAQKYFNFKGRHLNRMLTLLKKGYLSRRKINQVKFIYKLTKKYLKVYDILNSYRSSPISQ